MIPFVLAVVIGCSPARQALFVAKDYWWRAFNRDGRLERELAAAARSLEHGFHLLTVDTGQNVGEAIRSHIGEFPVDVIVCDPLVSVEIVDDDLLLEWPPTVLIDGARNETQALNRLVMSFDRAEAYRQAGFLCARLLEMADSGESILSELAGTDTKVGILAAIPSGSRQDELAAFELGFVEVADPERIVRKELRDVNNRIVARRSLETMKEDGAVIFVLATLNLTPYCLEILQQIGGLAVLEDWRSAYGYNEIVLLSIVEDVPEAFKAGLLWSEAPDERRPTGEVKVVLGDALPYSETVLRELGLMP